MAKLLSMPQQAIISGFRGTLDFYVYMGIPCVRSWPRSPGHDRAPAVQSTWPAFSIASKAWNLMSPEVQAAYRQMSAGLRMSARDLQIKTFLKSPIIDEFYP